MKTTLTVAGAAVGALVLMSGNGAGGLGMTLGGGAVLALAAAVALWVRRTMSEHG